MAKRKQARPRLLVTAYGTHVVVHAGAPLLSGLAGATGLAQGLSVAMPNQAVSRISGSNPAWRAPTRCTPDPQVGSNSREYQMRLVVAEHDEDFHPRPATFG